MTRKLLRERSNEFLKISFSEVCGMGGFCCVKIAIFDLQVEEFLVFLS